jgi:hypothetical protein
VLSSICRCNQVRELILITANTFWPSNHFNSSVLNSAIPRPPFLLPVSLHDRTATGFRSQRFTQTLIFGHFVSLPKITQLQHLILLRPLFLDYPSVAKTKTPKKKHGRPGAIVHQTSNIQQRRLSSLFFPLHLDSDESRFRYVVCNSRYVRLHAASALWKLCAPSSANRCLSSQFCKGRGGFSQQHLVKFRRQLMFQILPCSVTSHSLSSLAWITFLLLQQQSLLRLQYAFGPRRTLKFRVI